MNKQLIWIHPLFWISYLILYASTLRITHLELLSYQDLRHHQNHCLILGSSPLYHWHQYSSPFWSPKIRITTFSSTVTLLKKSTLCTGSTSLYFTISKSGIQHLHEQIQNFVHLRVYVSQLHTLLPWTERDFLCVFGARQRQWIQPP